MAPSIQKLYPARERAEELRLHGLCVSDGARGPEDYLQEIENYTNLRCAMAGW